MDDHELLREYVKGRSETAFAELVNRHVPLVYSTALRIVRNPALAEDVAQLVFVKLAQKADTVRAGMLPAWLYRVAYNQAITTLHSEEARRNREVEVMTMTEADADPTQAWHQIAPDLDAAMQTLSEAEQSAVVLRFFEGHNWQEVSLALAMSEDTAQRRVSSALEKLRGYFSRQGITVSAAVLGLAMGANAVQSAPASLGTHLAAGSLAAAGGTKSAGIVSSLVKSLLAKWQMTAAVVTGIAVVGITTTVVLNQSPTMNAETLRRGLVLHFGFDQEEADGRVSDTSGTGNHGQATGARWTPEGRHGGAYEFQADGDQIEVPNPPLLNPSNMTVSAWIKSPAPNARWRYIIEKAAPPGYFLAISGEGHDDTPQGLVHARLARNWCIRGETMVADGRWHQITVTFDGRRHCLYIDGQLEKESADEPLGMSNSSSLIIGRSISGSTPGTKGQSFRGLIDEVRIFDRALSPREVSFLFASADR